MDFVAEMINREMFERSAYLLDPEIRLYSGIMGGGNIILSILTFFSQNERKCPNSFS